MKIYVCVKQVPDTAANIKVTGGAAYDESVKFVMNPYDEYAVEEAVRLTKDHGGEVVVVSVGKASAVNTLRSALAVGADRGILVKIDIQFLDSATTAAALKAAILNDGRPDLIFTGKQSVDTEGMQTQYRLAKAMDLPVANAVVSFEIVDGKARVSREVDGGGREMLELTMPCVIGATKGLNQPRYPKLPDILKAKKKPIAEIAFSDLGLPKPDAFAAIDRLVPVPERGAAKMLQGSVREMVEKLVRALREEEKVL
ncbi:MAG: electron transfer flavoprotein subunit beta/FixA family protein [Desulfobacteraceae bacterium]|nr:MAG: electron transfer flavoprotein subunit beta/FixA family protein [Desulfobacteraceae bacterium]